MTATGADLAAVVQETYQYLFDEAHKALLEGGSFVPFGAGVRPNGERTHLHVDLPVETSTPQDHITGLIAGFRQERSAGLKVAGLVFDGGLITPEGDAPAMIVHVEAENGESVQVAIPYERLMATGDIRFKEPILTPTPPEIFTG